MKQTAIIIGAGIGGLCTAARLAHEGYHVTVIEKESMVGGRAHRLKQDGYTFDTGPTILMMTDVLYDTFSYCGKNFDDYIDLQQLEPNYKVWYPEGETLEVSSNLPRFAAELAKFDPKGPEQFYRFFADVSEMYRISRHKFIDKNFDKLTDFIDLKAGIQLLRRRGLTKLYSFVSRYFTDPRLRQLFSFQSMYLGVTPYEAPAIYSVVSYMETGLGIWYPKGGMHALPQALAKLCMDLGVDIRLNTPVQGITEEHKRVTGVDLEDGQHIASDLVISNADLTYTHRQLIADTGRKEYSNARLDKLKQASSALLFYWGINDPLDGILHHNVFFSKDFQHNLEEIFHDKKLPTDPAFYLYVPTKTDPTLAPKGNHVLYVLVPVPNLEGTIDWPKAIQRVKKQVLTRLKKDIGVDIGKAMQTEAVFTPEDFETKFNLTNGSAFGLSHTFFQSGYFRPHNVSRRIKGLYFVGASTYPGSGVPMVTLSGKLVVERILNDRKR